MEQQGPWEEGAEMERMIRKVDLCCAGALARWRAGGMRRMHLGIICRGSEAAFFSMSKRKGSKL